VRFALLILLIAGALALTARAPFAEQPPARIALLIGNQSYEPSVGILKNPHNDIALVSLALKRQGYEVLPPLKDATRVQILTAVRELTKRLNAAGVGAVGFLYYSGHGAAEADTKRNYLIPIDAKKPGAESFWDESVKLDDVLSLLNGANEAAKFVVFDACRNELRLPYRGAKGFEPVREQPGTYVAYTTAPGLPALDDGETSGPYAAALADEFAKPGLDHLSLFQNVKEAVYEATKHAQQPWAMDGLVKRVYLTGQPKPRPNDQNGRKGTDNELSVPKEACVVIGSSVVNKISVEIGSVLCSAAGQSRAQVDDITDYSIVYSVDGRQSTCRRMELCSFAWQGAPLFRLGATETRGKTKRAFLQPF
jgi:hypothetical protein